MRVESVNDGKNGKQRLILFIFVANYCLGKKKKKKEIYVLKK
jgi:hypothetical protein